MGAGGTERTSGYFGDQIPSESKKPSYPFRVWFYHFSSTPLLQPLLDQNDQSARYDSVLFTSADRDIFSISLELLKLQIPFSTIILNV
jgi:hypothetical protein